MWMSCQANHCWRRQTSLIRVADGAKDRGGSRYYINSHSLRFIHLDDTEAASYGEYLDQVEDK
jgi:peptide methionine sulfoxide reductase MsrB